MLTPEEELRIENLCENIGTEQLNAGAWEVQQFGWLVSKLKEINEECSKVWEELQDANEELARRAEFD
jgi:hypothetical protein